MSSEKSWAAVNSVAVQCSWLFVECRVSFVLTWIVGHFPKGLEMLFGNTILLAVCLGGIYTDEPLVSLLVSERRWRQTAGLSPGILPHVSYSFSWLIIVKCSWQAIQMLFERFIHFSCFVWTTIKAVWHCEVANNQPFWKMWLFTVLLAVFQVNPQLVRCMVYPLHHSVFLLCAG